LSKSNLKCVPAFNQRRISCISDGVVHVSSDDWNNPFLGVAFHVGRSEYDLVGVFHLVSFDMEQAIELEDPGFKLGTFSIEEVRFLNLNCVSSTGVTWLGGVHRSVTHLEGVQSVMAGQVANNKRAGVDYSSGWDSLIREWLIEQGCT
jgi:hypothetical protein